MKTVIEILIYLGLLYLLYRFLLRPIWRLFSRSKGRLHRWEQEEVDSARQELATLGPTDEARLPAIYNLFEAKTATLSATVCLAWRREEESAELQRRQADHSDPKRLKAQAFDVKVMLTVQRNLAGMDNRERTYLRVAELLNSAADGLDGRFRRWRAALIWGDGKGTSPKWDWENLRESDRDQPVPAAFGKCHLTVEQVLNEMQQLAASVAAVPDVDQRYRDILGELSEAMAPGGRGGAWLRSAEIPASPYASNSPYALQIGLLDDRVSLTYSGEGSMVTIAPPGSGKTQCNVLPSLLTWNGPAIILDISGDIYEKTAAWRAQNVGPVYKFSPLEPEDSHKYNPLAFVRREPDHIWEDSRLLAEMMIVPSLSADQFWENEARTVLTAAIAYVCHENPPDARPLHTVLDILFGGEPWRQMLVGLKTASDVRVMAQHATALSEMGEKTLNSVLQTARSSLSAWTGERVARATERSDWDPLDLRNGSNASVYIYIRPNEVDAYLSLLRVFIGQHIRRLTGGQVPSSEAPPILLMLDELPRLRYMAPIDEGLSIGRKYGLRLWMFAQSLGQFQTAYNNADGLLGSCAVRIFMNPGGADGLADKISDQLGYVDSVHDNSRRRLVESAELTGPEYQDLEIVFATGGKPAKVRKSYAFQDPELKRRMDLPVLPVSPAAPTAGSHLGGE